MGVPKRFQEQLNGEELFNMYFRNPSVETGRLSYNHLHRYVKEKYGKNPVTGNDYTQSAVWQSVQRYLIRNYDKPEIEAAFNMWFINFGLHPLSHEEYLHEVNTRARSVFSRNQYRNWANSHDDIEYLE